MIKIWKDISMLWKNEVNIFSTLGQHLVNNWSTYQWLTFGVGTMKNVQKMTKKIDFLKSMQWLPPMSWVIRDWIGDLVLPLKTFYDHFRIRWRNRKKSVKKSSFLTLNCPQGQKNSILWPFEALFPTNLKVIVKRILRWNKTPNLVPNHPRHRW